MYAGLRTLPIPDEPVARLPAATLAAVADRMRGRGLIDDTGRITDTGRENTERSMP
jgi:hypothetical protein